MSGKLKFAEPFSANAEMTTFTLAVNQTVISILVAVHLRANARSNYMVRAPGGRWFNSNRRESGCSSATMSLQPIVARRSGGR
jgi:hypothetical protein